MNAFRSVSNETIRKTFQKWLLIFVATAFALTMVVSFGVQTHQARRSTVELLRVRLGDARQQVEQNGDNLTAIRVITRASALAKARSLAEIIRRAPEVAEDPDALRALLGTIGVDEIHMVGADGRIRASTVPEVIGFDMASTPQSAAFMPLLEGQQKEYVQDPQKRGYEDARVMQYAGAALGDGKTGFVQVAYVPARLQRAIDLADLGHIAKGLRIGTHGGIFICDPDGNIIGASDGTPEGLLLEDLGLPADPVDGRPFRAAVNGKPSICLADRTPTALLIGFLPDNEMFADRGFVLTFFTVCHLALFALIFALVSALIQRVVIRGIDRVNGALGYITRGRLETRVQVETNLEFAALSAGINTMVDSLRKAIADAAARLDAELAAARAIQAAALPDASVLFPDRTDFLLASGMWAAKEVGGDFYDFFLLDDHRLALVIADVSGKGIPAALFMMTSKTVIKDVAETRDDPAEILMTANRRICADNESGLFVTVWMGILDLRTGRLRYANAGHNPPFVRRGGGDYAFLSNRPGLVLAGMPESRYTTLELTLAPGDRLFLYTDGATEANDRAAALYGDARLLATLNTAAELAPSGVIDAVRRDILAFADGADPFDDVTLLSLLFKGSSGD